MKKRSTLNQELPLSSADLEDKPDKDAAGLAGDDQGLSDVAEADSESVRDLAAEGQIREAEIVDAIENAPDADVSEVRTRQVPEDDVPPEYLNPDLD
jgi:hypothetical protein